MTLHIFSDLQQFQTSGEYMPKTGHGDYAGRASWQNWLFLSDPCAHGVRSLGRLSLYLSIYERLLKPCEDLVKTVNVVNVVKT